MEDNLIDTNNKNEDFMKKSEVASFFRQLTDNISNLFSLPESITAPKIESLQICYADCLIINEKNELLILQRSSLDDFQAGKWCLPGGKVDAGETFEQAAYRELFEETGLYGLELQELFQIENEKAIIHVFGANCNTFKNIILDNEEHIQHTYVKFCDIDNYDFMLDVKQNLKDWLDLPDGNINEFDLDKFKSIEKSYNIIKESFNKGDISLELFLEHKIKFQTIEDFYKAKKIDFKDDKQDDQTEEDEGQDHSEGENKKNAQKDDAPGQDSEDDSNDNSNNSQPNKLKDKKAPKVKKAPITPVVNQSAPNWQSEESM